MNRTFAAVVGLFFLFDSLPVQAGCSSCTIRSSREDSPAYCDDLHANVCGKQDHIAAGEQVGPAAAVPAPILPSPPQQDRGDLNPKSRSLPADGTNPSYIEEYVQPAYEKMMAQHGVKTYSEYAKLRLGSKFKIDVSAETEKTWKLFFTEGVTASQYAKLFPELGVCSNALEDFSKRMKKLSKNEPGIRALRTELIAYRDKLKEDLILQSARNVRAFVQDYLATICRYYLVKYPDEKPNLSPEDVRKCRSYAELSKEAIYFPNESDPSYSQKAEAYVRKWFVEPPYAFGGFEISEENKIPHLEASTNAVIEGLGYACTFRNSAQKFGIKKADNDIYNDFFKSKIFIDDVFDKLITPERQTKIKKIGEKVRAWIEKKIRSMKCAPESVIQEAVKEMHSIPISPLERPKGSEYEKNTQGDLILRDVPWGEYATPVYRIFGNGDASFLSQTNAYYMPRYGKRRPYVMVTGDNYKNIETDSNGVEFDLAHEFGHELDVSAVMTKSRPELTKCYSKTLECLQKGSQMQIRESQDNETIADVFSVEYIADQLEKISADERRKEFESYMEGNCRYAKGATDKFRTYEADVHPDWMLRINTIIGGNKKLRKALGCSLSSKTIPICELPFGGKEK